MLGIIHIHGDQDGHDEHDQDGKTIFRAKYLGEPAALGLRVDDADRIGSLGILPDADQEVDDLRRHVIHHQGEQGLIGIKVRLEEGRNDAPQHTGNGTHHNNEDQCDRQGKRVAKIDHERCARRAAHQNLSLCADVPEAHPESGNQTDCDHKQDHGLSDSDPDPSLGSNSALDDTCVHLQGILFGDRHNDDRAYDEGEKNGRQADRPGFAPGDRVPLFHMNDCASGGFILFAHQAFSFPPVIRRPSSSLVDSLALTIPLTLPPARTRILSHRLKRTSRSSPTHMTHAPALFCSLSRL